MASSRTRRIGLLCAALLCFGVLSELWIPAMDSNTEQTTGHPKQQQSLAPHTRLLQSEKLQPIKREKTTMISPNKYIISDQELPPIAAYRNYLFSCFYRSAQPFYHGREVPSLKWILVMIASLFDATTVNRHKTRTAGTTADGGNGHQTYAVVVMFVDAGTREQLLRQLAQKPTLHKQLVDSGFLRLVTVHMKEDPLPLGVTAGFVNATDSFPSYGEERWVSGIKNSANNWRFLEIHNYLSMIKAERRGAGILPSFEETKVVVADATDVLFQLDPFDESQSKGCWAPSYPQDILHSRNEAGGEKKNSPLPPLPFVTFTLEYASKSFTNEQYNRRWMGCYGEEYAPLPHGSKRRTWLSAKPISCAGVTLGNAEGILRYTKRQIAEIKRPFLVDCAITKIDAALDQATHNFILHHTTQFMPGAAASQHAPTFPFKPPTSNEANVQEASTIDGKRSKDLFFVQGALHDVDNCVFHGNFGKLKLHEVSTADGELSSSAGKAKRVKSDGKKNLGALGSSSSGSTYAIVHQYTSNRHPAVMKVAQELYDL